MAFWSLGLTLKLKLQYSGHLMRRVDSLEKTLMLGQIEGKRIRGWQDKMVGWHHWLNGCESEQTERQRTRKPGMLQSMGLQTWTQLSDWTTTTRWLLLHKETLNTLAIVPTTEFARQLKLASFLTCIFKSWSCLSSDNWKFGGGCFLRYKVYTYKLELRFSANRIPILS